MGLSPDFLEILRCPACKGRIEPTADGSALKCAGCRRIYPVRDDIPILIVEEAMIEKEEATA